MDIAPFSFAVDSCVGQKQKEVSGWRWFLLAAPESERIRWGAGPNLW
jgi:hypothetical protein